MDFVGSNGAVVSTFEQQLYSVHLSANQLEKVIDWNAKIRSQRKHYYHDR